MTKTSNRRSVVWFNLPYGENVETDVGPEFLKLSSSFNIIDSIIRAIKMSCLQLYAGYGRNYLGYNKKVLSTVLITASTLLLNRRAIIEPKPLAPLTVNASKSRSDVKHKYFLQSKRFGRCHRFRKKNCVLR